MGLANWTRSVVREMVSLIRNADAFIGHGRALETFLVLVKFQYALLLSIAPRNILLFTAVTESGNQVIFAAIFFVIGCIQATGLVLNLEGNSMCHRYRVIGGTLAIMLWIYVITRTFLSGFATAIYPWAITAMLGSMWIVRRGTLGLPHPGAPGAV